MGVIVVLLGGVVAVIPPDVAFSFVGWIWLCSSGVTEIGVKRSGRLAVTADGERASLKLLAF